MKNWIWLTPLFLLTIVWMIGQGCSSTPATPAAAATNTPVPAGPTDTPTNSPTQTPTTTPGNTATTTPTDTPGNTATDSPTNSPTNSPTTTPTQTPTATPILKSFYNFEASLDNWGFDTGIAGAAGGLSTAQARTGAQSAGVTFGAAAGNENFRVDFPSPQDLTGKSISFWIYVDTTAVDQISIFEQNTSYAFYEGGIYTAPTFNNLNHWVQYRYTYNGNGGNLNQDNNLAIQFHSTGSGAGHVYIDDIRIETAPISWNFEDGLADAFNYGQLNGITVTQTGTAAPGGTGNGSSSAFSFTAGPFSGTNQSVQVQYNFFPAANWTAMGISSISADVFISSDISDNGSQGVQLFTQSGAGYHFENSSYTSLTSGTWAPVTFTPPFTGGGSGADVKWFGAQFSTGGAGTSWGTGDIRIDNVLLY